MKNCTKCKEPKPLDSFYKRENGYYLQCKSCMKWQQAIWRKSNRNKIKEWEQRPKNIIKRRKWKRQWDRRAMLDPIHRLNNNMRRGMHFVLRGKKAGTKWERLVGYTSEDLIKHLQSKFTAEISWDNYGTHWHIDHITPKSWFDYTSPADPKFKECWALSNLQPKLKLDNIRKGNRFAG